MVCRLCRQNFEEYWTFQSLEKFLYLSMIFFHSNQTKEERTFTKSAGSSENARRCQITIKVGKFHFRQKMESSG